MLEDRIIYLNGEFVAWEKATVHVMSHSLARGSAIFEVMSFHQTENGPALFRLDEHVNRLFRTAELLSMKLALSKEALQQAVLETVKINKLNEGIVKLICYYHHIAFDILCPDKALDVCVVAADPALDFGGFSSCRPEGISACVCKWRKLHPETVPIEAKVAANYLNGMMARMEATGRGFEVGIMLDTEGFIAEGSIESVLLVKDGILTAPVLGTVLRGVSRKSLFEAAERTNIETVEKRLAPQALTEADEIFVSCSPEKIVPVKRIEDRVIPGVPGPVTKRISTLFDEICSGRNPQFKDWLFPAR